MERFPALLALCVGNSPVTGEFSVQRLVTRSFDVSLSVPWINSSVNNREVDDSRRHHSHYDVILMTTAITRSHSSCWISDIDSCARGWFTTPLFTATLPLDLWCTLIIISTQKFHSILDDTTFYSERSRRCIKMRVFLFLARLSYSKLVEHGYIHITLYGYFIKCSLTEKIVKYGKKIYDSPFPR